MVLLIFSCSLYYSGINVDWDILSLTLLPVAFLYGEAAHYVAHRYQQHQKIRFQKQAFEMHSIWHHGMFDNKNMHVETFSDMNMIVLPFFVHGFVIGLIYVPVAVLVEIYFLSDIGWLLVFSITLQLLWYEVVHTLSHLKNPPLLKGLTLHHREHHNPEHMGKYNFGIGTTLFDRLLGTRQFHS